MVTFGMLELISTKLISTNIVTHHHQILALLEPKTQLKQFRQGADKGHQQAAQQQHGKEEVPGAIRSVAAVFLVKYPADSRYI